MPEFVAYDQGRTEGKAEERVESIKIFVRDKIEDEISVEKIIVKLKKNYDLSADEAKRYIDQCMAEIN